MSVNLVRPAPITYAGSDLDDVIGRHVMIRPYFHVPVSRTCFASKRSPWAFEAVVVERFGGPESDMVLVNFLDSAGPWRDCGAYHVRECHQKGTCACAACRVGGSGIRELRGA